MKLITTQNLLALVSIKRIYGRLGLLVLAATATLLASATPYTVNSFADNTTAGDNLTTLREAINAANGSVGPHTISVPAGTYNLTLGQLRFGDISGQNITIQGTGGIAVINMTTTNRNRIFNIDFNSIGNVSAYLKNLKLSGGVANDYAAYGGAGTDAGGAILCGGPADVVNISNCTFENNTVATTGTVYNYGGAITCLTSTNLIIDGCTFTGNIDPSGNRQGNGGAIYYDIYLYNGASPSATLSITNCTFTNNSTGAGGNGGAISVEAAQVQPGQNIPVTISRNVFTGNSASSTGQGGAIRINTDRSTIAINYNRFVNNTALNGSGLLVTDQDGDVDATNNWWGCNGGPTSCADKAEQTAGNNGPGILTATPYLQLKTSVTNTSLCAGASTTVTSSFTSNSAGNTIATSNLTAFTGITTTYTATLSASTPASATMTNGVATTTYTAGSTAGTGTVNSVLDNVPSSDATARASITVNALPGFSSQPTSVTSGACTGNPVSFTAAGSGSGTLSYQWYKGSTALTNGTTGSGSIISGATTATLTISNASPSDNFTSYNVVVSSSTGCTPATSNNVSLTITPPATATATSTATESISSSNTLITNTACNPIVNVAPSGAAPVSGNVTATVTVQGSVQTSSNGSPYVPRYYDITPATNASTATATLTLYYTQAEFTAYNAYSGHGLNLPVDATDAANYKANIRIYIFHGTPNGGGNFPGPTEAIDPPDPNILYNSTYSRWEITFATTGFSRYYLASAGSTILPLSSIALSGRTDGNTAWLNWKVTGEKDVDHYEVERSSDGSRFTTAGQVAAGSSYAFADQPAEKVVYYYRIKAVDKDGRMAYSSIIAISLKKGGAVVQVLPNPFKEKLLLNISTVQAGETELRLVDMSGRVLLRKMVTLPAGTNAVTLNDLSGLAKGTYQLQVNSNSLHETIKVMKVE